MPLKLMVLVGLGIAVELRVDYFTCAGFFFFISLLKDICQVPTAAGAESIL